MPPYKGVTSKAQSRKLFALAADGKISTDDARGKTRAADFAKLPERKVPKRPTSSVAMKGKRGRRSAPRRPGR
jgi:hypothetical protein